VKAGGQLAKSASWVRGMAHAKADEETTSQGLGRAA
jgi:hypothetical protein